jgi:hypothetical protein
MSDLKTIEDSIVYAKARIEKGDALERLNANPDFKRLIVDDYLREQAARLVHLYGSGVLTAEQRPEVERDMHAIGALKHYFYRLVNDANQADSDLASAEYALQEYLSEAQAADPLEEAMANAYDTRGLGA